MKYAVIKLAGKQFKVSEGDIFEIERQEKLEMDVLVLNDEGKTLLGTPILKDVTVTATILDNKLGEKINVSRYKSKSRYTRNKGHRQPLSVIKIEKISSGKEKEAKADKKVEEAAKETAKPAAKKAPVKKSTKKTKEE